MRCGTKFAGLNLLGYATPQHVFLDNPARSKSGRGYSWSEQSNHDPANSNSNCTNRAGGPFTRASKFGTHDYRLCISAHCGLDLPLGIWARHPNRTCNLESSQAQEAEERCYRRLIKTPGRISERSPRGGLFVLVRLGGSAFTLS